MMAAVVMAVTRRVVVMVLTKRRMSKVFTMMSKVFVMMSKVFAMMRTIGLCASSGRSGIAKVRLWIVRGSQRRKFLV